jgi:hypothetical protein
MEEELKLYEPKSLHDARLISPKSFQQELNMQD